MGILKSCDAFPTTRLAIFDFPPEVKACRLTRNLLLKVAEVSRADVMCKIFSDSEALVVPVIITDADGRKQNDDPQKKHLLNESDLKKVQQVCIENIKKAATEGKLQKSDRFLWLLQCWKLWSGTSDAADWAARYVNDANSAMIIVMAAVNISITSNHSGTQYVDSLLLKWLEQFVDLDQVWSHLSSMVRESLDRRQQHVIKLFERGLENKKLGKPYDQIGDSN